MIIFGFHLTKKKFFLYTLFVTIFLMIVKLLDFGEDSSNGEEFPRNINIEDVSNLFIAADKTNVVVILFDPIVLQAWNNNYNKNFDQIYECIFICHAVGILHFAILETEFKYKGLFFAMMVEHNFSVSQFYNEKKELAHIVVQRYGAALHITILHWQDSGYWYQSAIIGSAHEMFVVKQFITIDSWNYISKDRAYERFDTRKVKIDGVRMTIPSDINTFVKDFKSTHFIPCNLKRMEEFNIKYPISKDHEARRFRHISLKLLAKAKALLDQLSIPFWLSSGTCLGYYRQCDIIPWAKDVDLGIFIEDYSPKIVDAFEKRGLQLIHKFGKVEDSLELSFMDMGGDVKLDIFFFYTEGATVWNGGTQARTGKKFKYVFPLFNLCWTEFLKMKLHIPCQIDDYIKANYGDGWDRPQKEWDWKSSPPNVVENGVWTEAERPKVIQIFEIAGKVN